jgi:hypothetical protein
MSVITQLSFSLIVFMLYPGQVFSFQEMEEFSVSSAALDNQLHHSETILLRYTEKNNSIREAEGGASLHIYEDGYAVVYYPPYMRRAGKYGIYLDQSDLERLWTLLSSKYILEFNKDTVRQRLYAEDQTQDELSRKLSNVANASTTLIEIYPNRYQSVGFGDGSREAIKKISWYGLKWDASKYQGIDEIQDLVVIQQELLAIMQRPDLQKIE